MKDPDQCDLSGEGWLWLISQGTVHQGREVRQQELEAGAHTASAHKCAEIVSSQPDTAKVIREVGDLS